MRYIVMLVLVLSFGHLMAQENQDKITTDECSCLMVENLRWSYSATDSFAIANCNCDFEEYRVVLYNRWGQTLYDQSKNCIIKSELVTALSAGTYVGVFSYANKKEEIKKQSFTLIVI